MDVLRPSRRLEWSAPTSVNRKPLYPTSDSSHFRNLCTGIRLVCIRIASGFNSESCLPGGFIVRLATGTQLTRINFLRETWRVTKPLMITGRAHETTLRSGRSTDPRGTRRAVWVMVLSCVPVLLAGNGVRAEIIEPSNPTVATHWLSSGDTQFGFNDLGGGYISCVLPGETGAPPDQCPSSFGDENIVSVGYGRGWQMAIRDQLHRGRHNPTQAGFKDSAGTPASVSEGDSCGGAWRTGVR